MRETPQVYYCNPKVPLISGFGIEEFMIGLLWSRGRPMCGIRDTGIHRGPKNWSIYITIGLKLNDI